MRIGVTDEAIARVKVILKSQPEDTFVRVWVEGGGCSGYQYKFDLDKKMEGDSILDDVMLIDQYSIQYMNGAIIDFVDEIAGSYFKVENPQAKASCGCGTSFSV
jgi:iron-sulfur cluster assembly accessory protein